MNFVHSGYLSTAKQAMAAGLSGAASPQSLLVAFDFDDTIIPCNSDLEVPRLVSKEVYDIKVAEWRRMVAEAPSAPAPPPCWTTFMSSVFAELAARGHSRADLADALATIRIHPDLVDALHGLKRRSHGVEPRARLVVVSDANEFFIEEVRCGGAPQPAT